MKIETGEGLVRQIAERVHLKLAAAQNLPYEEGDVCDECLVFARELAALVRKNDEHKFAHSTGTVGSRT